MPDHPHRYDGPLECQVDPAWTLRRLTPPSRLYGANGLRTAADGRIYVAQVNGSQISAVDIHSGAIETISPMGGGIVAPDDIAFDAAGNIYATEYTEGRVSMLAPDGSTRVIHGDLPGANPITLFQGRLFAGECRPGGRVMELRLDGGAPRLLLDNAPMPNAMEVGPDGMLYIPMMGTNEIWRIHPDGGTPEVVARELGVPDAVKFDAEGFIVSTQVASGQVLRIDPRSGARTVVAELAPGLDNLTFVSNRLFVSSMPGDISEILPDGTVAPLLPGGLNWPLGLAIDPDGSLLVADGAFVYRVAADVDRQCLGMLFTPGSPGYVRAAVAVGSGDYIVTTGNGQVARWGPRAQESHIIAQGFDRLYGVDVTAEGSVVVAEDGTGRLLLCEGDNITLLADGIEGPRGVALTPQGTCLVVEEQAGRVVETTSSGARLRTVIDGLDRPHGIAVHDGSIYVVDTGSRTLIEIDRASGRRRDIARRLPVGAPPGVLPKPLKAVPPFAGPMFPFADVVAGEDGTLYLSADLEGSVIALSPRRASS